MPLMPAPPMPTKWMCLTACFMRPRHCAPAPRVRDRLAIGSTPVMPRTSRSISSATRAAACGRASARAFVAIASSASRVRPPSRSASRARRQLGLRQVDRRRRARPSTRALSRWCEVVLTTSGTSTAATPAAHSSLTVIAPARQTIRSQAASRAAMSSMKGSTSAVDAGCGVGAPARRRGPPAPVWCVTVGPLVAAASSASACGTALVQHPRAQAAADDQQAQRAARGRRSARAGSGSASISARTGLPVTTALRADAAAARRRSRRRPCRPPAAAPCCSAAARRRR